MKSFSFFRLLQFVLLGLTLIILPLAPVNFLPRAFPMPDLLFCFVVAWHLRDPQSSPILVILLLITFADIVGFRPIGLWPLIMIAISNIIIVNRRLFFNAFLKETLFFSGIFFCALMVELCFLTITYSQSPGFSASTQEGIITSFAYPFVVLFLNFFCRLNYDMNRLFFSDQT